VTCYLPRTEEGVRIPREGSTARAIYELWVQQVPVKEIAQRLGRKMNNVSVVIWRFRNPVKHNAASHRDYISRRVA
jgi:hypothetical protein